MIPVLYEVLTTHMGVAPRAAGGGPGTPSILPSGSQLTPGQQISSPDGRYRLIFQTDGNLVIYRADGVPVWWTGTVGISPNVARMQTDGNFVIYDTANTAALAHPHVREPWRLPVDAEQRRLRDQHAPAARGSGEAPSLPTK